MKLKTLLYTAALFGALGMTSVNAQSTSANAMIGFDGNAITPRAGECYGQVTTPAETRVETKKVETRPASKEIVKVIPAKYGTEKVEIVSKEASEKLIVIPATFKTVREKVVVEAPKDKIITVPAKYETRTEKVMVSPARTEWKVGTSGPITKVDAKTGEVRCLVEVPAVYKTVSKKVLVTPASTRTETIPAVTKLVERSVVDQVSRVEKRAIPAVKKTITKRVVTTPEKVVYKNTPAEFKTVSNEIVVKAGKSGWAKILCQDNAEIPTVKRIQLALNQAGFNAGTVDGVLGYQTYKAIDSFQKKNSLPRGEITYTTLEKLGVSL